MKKLLIILLLSTLQSCSDGYVKKRDFRVVNNSEIIKDSAIILTKTSAKSISTGALKSIYGDGFTEMNWCLDEEKKRCKEIFYINSYTRKKINNEIGYYVVKSGTYYLDEIKGLRNHPENFILVPIDILISAVTRSGGGMFSKTEPNFNTSPSGWNKKLNAPNFASFEAKPNEIVYIGDLFFTFTKQKYWMKGKINLEVQDNYDQAVSYFKSQHPEYKDRPVIKRLVQPGVLLDNYDAGIFW